MGKTGDELEIMLRRVTLQDVVHALAVLNLTDGKVWMGYQSLKDFFDTVQLPEAIKEALGRPVIFRDIDHAMSGLMESTGLSYTGEVGDTYWHFKHDHAVREIRKIQGYPPETREAVMDLARQYGKLLQELGR